MFLHGGVASVGGTGVPVTPPPPPFVSPYDRWHQVSALTLAQCDQPPPPLKNHGHSPDLHLGARQNPCLISRRFTFAFTCEVLLGESSAKVSVLCNYICVIFRT